MTATRTLVSIATLVAVLTGCFGCGDNSVDPPAPGDTTRPTVTATLPEDGDTTASVNSVITATFSETMDVATLTGSVLTLEPQVTGTVSATSTTVSFAPTASLDTNVTYTATVSTAARDAAGNALAAPYAWQFRTYFDTVPPTVTLVSPPPGDSSVSVNAPITITFSEKMDASTLNASSVLFNPAVFGSFLKTDRVFTFTPALPLDTLQLYEVTVTTEVADSTGNHLAAPYVWQFYTYPDTVSPHATVVSPAENAVVGDSVLITAAATDNEEIARVEFYIDGVHVAGADDTTPPYEYTWDASGLEVASTHTISVFAFDGSGNSAASDTVTVNYLWMLLVEDPDEFIPRNIHRVFGRSTSTELQFRVKTYNGWGDYRDSAGGIDMVFFIDSDRDSTTGDTETDSASPKPIGDIGADHLMVVGFHGLYYQDWTGTTWGTPEGIDDLVIENDTNMFEISVNLGRIGGPESVDVIIANYHVTLKEWDWAPDLSVGHVTVDIDRSFAGSPASRTSRVQALSRPGPIGPTPFD